MRAIDCFVCGRPCCALCINDDGLCVTCLSLALTREFLRELTDDDADAAACCTDVDDLEDQIVPAGTPEDALIEDDEVIVGDEDDGEF